MLFWVINEETGLTLIAISFGASFTSVKDFSKNDSEGIPYFLEVRELSTIALLVRLLLSANSISVSRVKNGIIR